MTVYDYGDIEIPFSIVAGLWQGYDSKWSAMHDITTVINTIHGWQLKEGLNVVQTIEKLRCAGGTRSDGKPEIEDGVRITGSLPSSTPENEAWELLKQLVQTVFGPVHEMTVIVYLNGRPRRLRPRQAAGAT
ncbi:MAG TPA: hypothetical protein V6C69_03190 [Trichormus sp.]|jgi:hypothetical protein